MVGDGRRVFGSEAASRSITIPPAVERGALVPEPMPLAILYEDADVIVIDKPAGLVVHPGAGNWTGTLVHGILAHAPEVRTNDEVRPGIVHRLDKETSGVLIVAKHDARAGIPRPPTARPHSEKELHGARPWRSRARPDDERADCPRSACSASGWRLCDRTTRDEHLACRRAVGRLSHSSMLTCVRAGRIKSASMARTSAIRSRGIAYTRRGASRHPG